MILQANPKKNYAKKQIKKKELSWKKSKSLKSIQKIDITQIIIKKTKSEP